MNANRKERWGRDEWEGLDWRKPNRQLAVETGKSAAWIAHRRCQLRKPKATLKFREDLYRTTGLTGDSAPCKGPQCQRAMIRAVRKRWRLVSPNGIVIEGSNLRELVRKHEGLFPEGSTVWTVNGFGRTSCQAERKLYHSAARGVGWKGWTAEKINAQGKAQIRRVLQIAENVAKARGLPVADLLGRKRTASVVLARAEAMQAARNEGYEHAVIGSAFKRTQGAVSYAINKIRVRADPQTSQAP